MKANRGITLIALVITVIILIILSGVALSMITGNDGIFTKANEAASLYNQKAQEEADYLEELIQDNPWLNGGHRRDKLPPKPFEFIITGLGENKITVSANTTDADATATSSSSAVIRYQYKLDNGEWKPAVPTINNTYTFTELMVGSNHMVSVKAIDEAGNETEATNNGASVTTLTPVPDLVKGTNVAFTYDPSGYVNPSKDGPVSVGISTTETVYTLQYSVDEGRNWEEYSEPIEVIEYNKVILAKLIDKATNREGGVETANVTNIDRLGPQEFELTATSEETTITVSATVEDADATSTSGKSGIRGYQYKLNDGTWTEEEIDATHIFTGLTRGKKYTVSMRAIDEAGNITEATNKDFEISTQLILTIGDTVILENYPFFVMAFTETNVTLLLKKTYGSNANWYDAQKSASAFGKSLGGSGRLLTKAEAEGLAATYRNIGITYWFNAAAYGGDYGLGGAVTSGGAINYYGVYDYKFGVRPVVIISKSLLVEE